MRSATSVDRFDVRTESADARAAASEETADVRSATSVDRFDVRTESADARAFDSTNAALFTNAVVAGVTSLLDWSGVTNEILRAVTEPFLSLAVDILLSAIFSLITLLSKSWMVSIALAATFALTTAASASFAVVTALSTSWGVPMASAATFALVTALF